MTWYPSLEGAWKHIRILEWNWERDVTLVSLEMVRSLAQEVDPIDLDLVLIYVFLLSPHNSPTKIGLFAIMLTFRLISMLLVPAQVYVKALALIFTAYIYFLIVM